MIQPEQEQENEQGDDGITYPSSPRWKQSSKLFVSFWLLIGLALTIFVFRNIFRSLFMAIVLAFVLRPTVDFLARRGISRTLSSLTIILLIIASLIAIPASTAPFLINRVVDLVNEIPGLVQQLSDQVLGFLRNPIFQFRGKPYTIPIDVNNLPVTELERYIGDAVSLLGNLGTYLSDLVTLLASNIFIFTSNILIFISSVVFILFVTFYLTRDGHLIAEGIINFAPESYHGDIRYLIERGNIIWGAFLRGQIMLMLLVGGIVFVVATILGLPNPVGLAVIAGLFEVIPYLGPILSAAPGLLLAFFQNDASWLGMRVGPFWFTLIVAFSYWMVQNLENYWFVPRIMGNRLKLHRAVVFTGALAGWQIGGIFGVLVAAPTIATLRELILYLYCKLSDQAIPRKVADNAPITQIAAEIIPDPIPTVEPPPHFPPQPAPSPPPQ